MSYKENIVHCLFEQSGTFKKEFLKLGFKAYDYDILRSEISSQYASRFIRQYILDESGCDVIE